MSYGNNRTAGDVIEEVIGLMLSGEREPLNKLAVSVGTNANTLTMEYDVGDIGRSSLVEIDLEVYRVWSVDTATKTLTVEPAMMGSVTATHEAGALVRINPRVQRQAALTAINNELDALSSPALGLFSVMTNDIVVDGIQTEYNLDPGSIPILDILAVRMNDASGDNHWTDLYDWELRRNTDATIYDYGYSFNGPPGIYLPMAAPGRTVQVVFSTGFLHATRLDDNLETWCGMRSEQQDILVLGCLLRLGAVREIKRNFTEYQGDTRRAAEVPATAVGNSFSYVRAMRQQRIDEESARLARMYPPIRRRI